MDINTFKRHLKVYPHFFSLLQKCRYILNRILRPRFLYALLQSSKPISAVYGLDRGAAIDRYYIEGFLQEQSRSISGVCLEVLDNTYTLRFGKNLVKRSDVLDIDPGNSNASICADLRHLSLVNSNTYDCIILTQVLQFIDDVPAAVSECYRILKPGGVVLASLPCVSRVDPVAGVQGDYWRFTTASARYLFAKSFANGRLDIRAYGNVQVCISFLAGLAWHEISKKLLNFTDENFPCIITVRAIK